MQITVLLVLNPKAGGILPQEKYQHKPHHSFAITAEHWAVTVKCCCILFASIYSQLTDLHSASTAMWCELNESMACGTETGAASKHGWKAHLCVSWIMLKLMGVDNIQSTLALKKCSAAIPVAVNAHPYQHFVAPGPSGTGGGVGGRCSSGCVSWGLAPSGQLVSWGRWEAAA